MTTATHDVLLTVSDLCSRLKVSPATIHRLKDARIIPFLKVGGSVRFRMSDIEAYLESETLRPVVQKKYGC